MGLICESFYDLFCDSGTTPAARGTSSLAPGSMFIQPGSLAVSWASLADPAAQRQVSAPAVRLPRAHKWVVLECSSAVGRELSEGEGSSLVLQAAHSGQCWVKGSGQ